MKQATHSIANSETGSANGLLLFNPWATTSPRVPNSVLQIAAAVSDLVPIDIVDGNLEDDPWPAICSALSSGQFAYFGATVMPGPQLKQAVPITRKVRENFPNIKIFWGGYFASNQPDAVIQDGCVDYVFNGPADNSLRTLIQLLEAGELNEEKNLNGVIFRKDDKIIRSGKGGIPDMTAMPPLPYDVLARRYPIEKYVPRTFLGRHTHSIHTSMGCPFMCSFCAVVPIFDGRWKGMPGDRVADDVLMARDRFGADAIEFSDNNFFVSEKRVRAFAERMVGQGVTWWGEARIDTMNTYSDDTLKLIREAGCKAIFFGAETGDDDVLSQINKGGKQTGQQILDFAERLGQVGIMPEYSFVLGFPQETEAAVWAQIKKDIAFIREVKRRNPATEIIIYIYSPVPTEGSELNKQIEAAGFAFPKTLDEWLSPVWESFDLHRNPLTPWLTAEMVEYIHNFETVLNARYPTRSHFRTRGLKRVLMQALAAPRYHLGLYQDPFELRFMQKLYRYVRPETQGFYAET